jgi:methionyl-tRNA formyltransferase
MKNGGVEGAIPFCNTKAYSLTEKLSESNEALIKRTSDKIRNEKNKPNEEEMEILAYYKKLHEESSLLEPVVKLNKNGKISYYTPILIKNA